jgi:hypothetical protein
MQLLEHDNTANVLLLQAQINQTGSQQNSSKHNNCANTS